MRTIRKLSLLPSAALLVSLGAPTVALADGESGNICVRDYRGGAVCTANDVRIEELIVVDVIESCAAGTPGETEVQFRVMMSSDGSPDRYDIGMFLALDGGSALSGDNCYHDYLDPPLTATPTYGDFNADTIVDIVDGPWWNGGTDGDTCGDIETDTQVFKTLPALRFACVDSNGDGYADVSAAVSWDNNTNTACNTVTEAFPGTNSKCSTSVVELGVPPAPEITIEKSPSTQNVVSGGDANFTLTVTGRTTVSNVVVSDPDCDATPAFQGGDTNNDNILTPDETWVYTCSKGNVASSFTNTATATGNGPLGQVQDTDSAVVIVSQYAMTLAKSGTLDDGGNGVDAGDTISYSFTVENTGTLELSNILVADSLDGLSAITCPGGNPIPSLPVGDSVTCVADLILTQAMVDSGGIDNTASATSTNILEPVTDEERVDLPARPSLLLVKSGVLDTGQNAVADVGDVIDYTLDVTNTGNVTLAAIGVSDPIIPTITCPGDNPIPSLAPAESVQCTGSYTLVQADIDAGARDNTATAAGAAPNGTPVEETGGDSVPLVAAPDLSLNKVGTFNDDAAADGLAQAGETIGYTITVQNTGNVTLSNVSVTDPLIGTVTCPGGNPIPSLAPTILVQCTGSYTLQAADVANGQVDNTATASDGQTSASGQATTPLTAGNPVIGVAKQVTAVTNAGGGLFDVDLSIVVENLGNIGLSNLQVVEDLATAFPAPVTFVVQAGPTAGGTLVANAGFNGGVDQNLLVAGSSTLAVGASATITVTVRIDLNGATGPFQNSVVASGDSQSGPTTDTSDDGTDPDPNGNGNPDEPGENDPTLITIPSIDMADVAATKTSSFDPGQDNDDSGNLTPGDNLTYTIEITNNGTADALGVVFDDTPDANTTLVVGSVTTTQGTVTSGNGPGDTAVAVDIGSLAANGGTATLTFDVTINLPLPVGIIPIANQGFVTGTNIPSVPTDDPDTPPSDDPTGDEVISRSFSPPAQPAVPVPTMSPWALGLFSIVLLGVVGAMRRRR